MTSIYDATVTVGDQTYSVSQVSDLVEAIRMAGPRREAILKSQNRTEFKFIISVVLMKPDPHHPNGRRMETWITTSARASVPDGMDRSDFYRQFGTQSLGKAISDAATTFPGYAYVSHAIAETEDL